MSGWARRRVETLIGGLFNKYDRYRLLQWLARDQGISGFVVDGEHGAIEGLVEDFAVLRTYAQTKVWAKATNERFAAFLADGGTYLDIGANLGLTTIPVARNPAVHCHAFEPDPTMFALLRVNLARNGALDNVTLHNIALSDQAATLTLERSPENAGDNRIRRAGDVASDRLANDTASWTTVAVPAQPLDDLGLKFRDPMAVKIDTQGSEALVLAGGRKVLARASLLTLEFWPHALTANAGEAGAIIDFLRETFHEGEIVRGESTEGSESLPVAALAERLEALSEADSADPDVYYDVTVRK